VRSPKEIPAFLAANFPEATGGACDVRELAAFSGRDLKALIIQKRPAFYGRARFLSRGKAAREKTARLFNAGLQRH
jgi:hypothetical protein